MRQVELTAGTIEYEESGAGHAVVLLHGLMMDHTLWDQVLPRLPAGFRYLRPVLPLGSHRLPMRAETDLLTRGQVQLVADFLQALDLQDVTLVHTDWGGGLFLTAYGLDERVGRLVIMPCEAFDNFPPGLPGQMATLAARLPGGLKLAVKQLRLGWLRRTRLLLGQMAKYPLPDQLIHKWTEPILSTPGVRRDLRGYASQRQHAASLARDTQALSQFTGNALVLWSPENVVMPPDHGTRLVDVLPAGHLVKVPDAYVLSMLDNPQVVAREITRFLHGPNPHSANHQT